MNTERGEKGYFAKGNKGKPKGADNLVTRKAKEIFAEVMAGEVSNVQSALMEVYEKDKAKYIDCLSKLLPYFMPKKVEMDHNIPEDSGIEVVVNVTKDVRNQGKE